MRRNVRIHYIFIAAALGFESVFMSLGTYPNLFLFVHGSRVSGSGVCRKYGFGGSSFSGSGGG